MTTTGGQAQGQGQARAQDSSPALSGEEIARMLGLMQGADSVELKLTVPESHQRSAIAALELDPLDVQIRQVVFFDTPGLALYEHGVVVRARRSQGGTNDSVVKLRPVVPTELSADLRNSPSFAVEVDAMPGGYVCSGALKAKLGTTHVKDAVDGRRPTRQLFSKAQRGLFAEHTERVPGGPAIDDLSVLGPITVFKLKFSPADFGRRLVAELWNYPDGSRILELSTKCAPTEAFQVAAEAKAFLSERGIDLSGEQQTKTRTALEYFSQMLAER